MASNSAILGAAGEHYVMSRLLMRGMIAALAPVNAPNADIVVTNKIGEPFIVPEGMLLQP
jgi:hypothetical protein